MCDVLVEVYQTLLNEFMMLLMIIF